MAEGNRNVWLWIGGGCLLLAMMGLMVCGVGGWFAVRKAQEFEQAMKDPDARARRVRDVLGVERLPEGYHPMVALTVPFVMRLAILTDREGEQAQPPSGFGDRGLIYVEYLSFGSSGKQELRDYFEGKTDDPAVLRRNHLSVDVDEILRRGVVRVDGADLLYVAQRGSVSAPTGGGGGAGQPGVRVSDGHGGITSLVLVDCGRERRTRLAIWFGPDPAPEVPAEELDVTGTPADEQALASFLGQFDLCR